MVDHLDSIITVEKSVIFPRLIKNSKKRCNRSLYETLENRVRTTNDLVSLVFEVVDSKNNVCFDFR